jgi:hypothetical protein
MPTFPHEYGIVSIPSGAVGAASSFQMRDQSFVLAGLTFPALTTGAKELRGGCAGSCIARGAVLTVGNHELAGTAIANSSATLIGLHNSNVPLAGTAISKTTALRCSIPSLAGGAWDKWYPKAEHKLWMQSGVTYVLPIGRPHIINASGDMVFAVREDTGSGEGVRVYKYNATANTVGLIASIAVGEVIGTRSVIAADTAFSTLTTDNNTAEDVNVLASFDYNATSGRWYCAIASNSNYSTFFMSGDTAGGNIIKRYMQDHDTTYAITSASVPHVRIVHWGTTVVLVYMTEYTASGKAYTTIAYLKSTDYGATWGSNTRPIAWGNVVRTHVPVSFMQATATGGQMYGAFNVFDTGTSAYWTRLAWIDFNANTAQTTGMIDFTANGNYYTMQRRSNHFVPRNNRGAYPTTVPYGYIQGPAGAYNWLSLYGISAVSDATWTTLSSPGAINLGGYYLGSHALATVKDPATGTMHTLSINRTPANGENYQVDGITSGTVTWDFSAMHTKYDAGALRFAHQYDMGSGSLDYTYLLSSNRNATGSGDAGMRIYKVAFSTLTLTYYMELRDLYGYGNATASLALSVTAAGAVVDIAASVAAMSTATCDILEGVAHDITCPATAIVTATLGLVVGGVEISGEAYGYSSAVASLRYTTIYLDGGVDSRTLSYCALYVSHPDDLSGVVGATAQASAALNRVVVLAAPAYAACAVQLTLLHELTLAGEALATVSAQATTLHEVPLAGVAHCVCTATLGMLRGVTAGGGGGIAVQSEAAVVVVTSAEEPIWVM